MAGSLSGKTVVMQGLGNVGYHAAKFLSEEDRVKVIAVIERDGVLLNEKGIGIENLHQYIVEHHTIKGFPDAMFNENGAGALELECDILIPAALEGQIHKGNAKNIKARLITEAANGPVTFEADEILRERKLTILPDAYINAGGVVVSYFEWIRNLSHIRFGRMQRRHDELRNSQYTALLEEHTGVKIPQHLKDTLGKGADEVDLVRSGLDDTMRMAFQELYGVYRSNERIEDFRTAAFYIAIQKISRSYLDIGVY